MHFVEAFFAFGFVGFARALRRGLTCTVSSVAVSRMYSGPYVAFGAPEHARAVAGDRVPDVQALIAQCRFARRRLPGPGRARSPACSAAFRVRTRTSPGAPSASSGTSDSNTTC